MIVSLATGSCGPVEPVELVVTVTVALAEITPVNPFMVAEICMLPGPTAVTNPVEVTVATSVESELQVTWFVTFTVLAG
jgi:hypothetical protein